MKRITARQWVIGGLLLLTVLAMIDVAGLMSGARFFDVNIGTMPRLIYEDADFMESYETRGELPSITDLPETLVITGFQGELTLARSQNDAIHASYVAKAHAASEEQAARLAEQMNVQWVRDGSRLVLHVDAPVSPVITINQMPVSFIASHNLQRSSDGSSSDGSLSLDMTIAVPDSVALDIDNRGVTKIDGVHADVAVKYNGVLSVSSVTGEVRLSSGTGVAELLRIHGPVFLDASGVIEATRIIGDVRGELRSGIGEFAEIQGNVDLELSGFRLQIDGLQGDLTVTGADGQRSFVDVEKVTGNVMTGGSVTVTSR